MASDLDFVKFVADQIDDRCEVSYRAMFGEYALYSRAKVVALICDDQLFVKPTEAGRSFVGDVVARSFGPQNFLAYKLSSACVRSLIRSSACSRPTDRRNRFCGVAVSGPSIDALCSIRLSVPPRLVALTIRRRAAATLIAAIA